MNIFLWAKPTLPTRNIIFFEKHLVSFIQTTLADKYEAIQENYRDDTILEIIKALKEEMSSKQLWLIMRDG